MSPVVVLMVTDPPTDSVPPLSSSTVIASALKFRLAEPWPVKEAASSEIAPPSWV